MALFRGIQEYIALDAINITLVFDSGNIVNISGNIFLYPPQGHPILYNSSKNFNIHCRGKYPSSEPLSHTGMDVFGPFMVKRARSLIKRYGLLFTCLCSRAAHVELLDDLTTDSFLNSLRCFLALRGAVKSQYCDRGTNFVGTDREIGKLLRWRNANRTF